MSALIVNSIEIPVAANEWQIEPEEIGERQRAVSGKSLASVRATKQKWTGSTVATDATLRAALRGLLSGAGHYWSFDTDLYSSKGAAPYPGHTGTLVTGYKKFGPGCLSLNIGEIDWYVGFSAPYTVACWSYESPSWHHYAYVHDGATAVTYRDGAAAAGISWISIASGILRLSTTVLLRLDDLIAVPYCWPSTWPATIYARTTAYPSLPFLEASGSLMPSGPTTCRGRLGQSKLTSLGVDSYLERMGFELSED